MIMSAKSKKCSAENNRSIIGLYQLFARLLAEELNPELVDILLQPEVSVVFSKADAQFSTYINKEIDYEATAADFCDIFILPGKPHCSPRAVAWLGEGNEVSADGIHAVVEAFLNETGIVPPPPFESLPFDHAAMLFFLAAKFREQQLSQTEVFEQTVLGTWVHQLGGKLSQCDMPVYRALGKLIAIA